MKIIALLVLLLAFGCVSEQVQVPQNQTKENGSVPSSGYINISEQQLNSMLQDKDFFLVDVHIPEVENHVNGTDAFIPYNEIESNIDKLPSDKDAKIVVYCRSGSMSRISAEKLVDLGYTNVVNVANGIEAYRTAPKEENPNAWLIEKVIPEQGVTLKAKWNDVGPLTIESGALNLTKFQNLMEKRRPLTDEQMAILVNGSDDYIDININNSVFLLDLFWAFGLVNHNPVLNGTMVENPAMLPRYASTGGWPLGDESGGVLYGSRKIIELNEAQQQLVEKIANSTYRPCCNNPTSFPDCNHGMAALGLLEWMAYQNLTEDEMYDALLAVNSYWFPPTYVGTAALFEANGTDWKDVDPRIILSYNYSSAAGYSKTSKKLEELPEIRIPAGSCGA